MGFLEFTLLGMRIGKANGKHMEHVIESRVL